MQSVRWTRIWYSSTVQMGGTMASTRQNGSYNRRTSYGPRGTYVDGNTVRRVQALPKEERQQHRKTISRTARKNRERAQSMSVVFVLFLAVVSVAVLITCVQFLQLKSQITRSIQKTAELESTYNQPKTDNDAYESQISSSVDLNQVKQAAMGQLGMKYPSENQIFTYQIEKGSYVRQYQDVPDAKE